MKRISAVAALMAPLVLLASLAGPESSARAQGAGAPQADPDFQRLLDELAQRAALYRLNALGFTCREVVIEAKYNIQTGGNRKSERTVYDYLFEEKPDGTLHEFRERMVLKDNGKWKPKKANFEPQVPSAYTWSSLFAESNRGRFLFRPAGRIVKAYRLLLLIDFIGQSPNPGGTSITGWSGQVAIDAKTKNIWSITAEPSGQDVRLEVEILKYNRAFAIAGVPLAARPHGWHLEVTFGFERQGLSYPTEQTLIMTSLSNTHHRMIMERRTTFRYENYRFFTETVYPEEMTGTDEDSEEEDPG